MIALIFLSPAASMAATLPQGGSIVAGEGNILNSGSNQLTIKQTTDKLGINWQSFNVGADGHVIFDQPGANSIAMNRVIGSDGSAILGKISANGQVFIINPNGVIFGKDSKVNVGGLVASTLNISDDDFTSGNYKFAAGSTSGDVINNGSLVAAEGGYIALLGRSVSNNGVIQAKLGTATLAAGGAVTLDFSGDGLINVQVDKSALKALAENKGLIQADGGEVLMTARATNALLDTVVNNEGIIQAQAIGTRGGKIFLDGGMESGTVQVAGTLDASAPVEGNGGFIETSGANVIVADGAKVTTLAKQGKTGEWLVDPTDFNIVSGSGALTASQIGATTLANSLKTYDGTTVAGSSLSDNRIGLDDLVVTSATSVFADKNAGAGKLVTVDGITIGGSDAGNYTWNTSTTTTADIAKANLTVDATGTNKVYDATTAAGVTFGDDRVAGDSLVIGGSASFADKNAGTGKAVNVAGINVTGADAGNYTWNSTASTTAAVSKASLTVSASGSNKTYDGNVSAGTALSDNRLGSDDLVIGSTGATYADKHAGANKQITVNGISVTGADAGNYVWNSVATATGTISKAILSVIADAQDKVYDGSTGASASFADNRINGDQFVISSSGASFDNKNSGSGKTATVNGITVTGADAQNYDWNTSATSSADISKASLTIKAGSTGKVVGSQDGALGWSIAGGSLFGSDTLQGSLARGPGEAAGIYAIEQGSLSAGSNYTLTVVPGIFEISKPATNVELEQTKDIISTITVTQKAVAPKTETTEPGKAKTESVIGDYRLLSLGMKLPDDLFTNESSRI